MKTVEISDSTFRKLETLRRSKRTSRDDALTQAIDQAFDRSKFADWWRNREPTPAAAKLSEKEVERLAVEGVREARRKYRQQQG